MGDTIRREEHVLGSTQADAFGAKGSRLNCIARNVRIRAHANFAEWLGPAEQLCQVFVVR